MQLAAEHWGDCMASYMWQARLVGVIWRYRRVCWHPTAHRRQSRRRNEHICNYIIAALCRQSSGFLLAVRRAVSFVRRQIEFPRRLQSPGQSCSRSAIMMCIGCSAMPSYYWSTRSARSAGERGWCSADLSFLILSSAFCQTNYLNIYRTDLHEICTIVRPLAVDELFEVIFFDPSRHVAVATNFVGKIDLQYLPCSSHDICYADSRQTNCSTRSSLLVDPHSTSSSLRITDRSFRYASSRLWNQLPASLRQPRTSLSNSDSPIVLWMALRVSVSSTHHSHYSSPYHSFKGKLSLASLWGRLIEYQLRLG